MNSFKVNPKRNPTFSSTCVFLGVLQTAMKELQIEQNLNDIQQQWETMRFVIQKHFRQGNVSQERGFILSDVDGIVQALEDSTLLLNGILPSIDFSSNTFFSFKGITTSKFVGIYLPQVEQWIRTLSLISEVIKIWTLVQQKWLYLENIFLGSNLQFGDETKRFETIDKLYRKIMLGQISLSLTASLIILDIFRGIAKCTCERFLYPSRPLR